MAPKAKKPTKAELAAEAERVAQEQRIADEIEAKRQEELRILREAEAAAEAERRRIEEGEHLARLASEAEVHGPSYAEEVAALQRERAAAEAQALWERYTRDTVLPDPGDQGKVHAFLYEWETNPTSADFDRTLDEWRDAATLRADILADSNLALEQGDAVKAAWQRDLVAELDAVVRSKLDAGTAAFLAAADELPEAQAGDVTRASSREGLFSVGLWVNLAKNPRTKSVGFPAVSLSAEIPKTLALGAVAVRALQCYVDMVTGDAEEAPVETSDEAPPEEEEEDPAAKEEAPTEAAATEPEAPAAAAPPAKAAEEAKPVEEAGVAEEGAAAAPPEGAVGETAAAEGEAPAEGEEGAGEEEEVEPEVEPEPEPEPPAPPVTWLTLGGTVTVDVLTLPPGSASAKVRLRRSSRGFRPTSTHLAKRWP